VQFRGFQSKESLPHISVDRSHIRIAENRTLFANRVKSIDNWLLLVYSLA